MLPDPELLDLRPEFAILAARMNELMIRIDENACQFAGEKILKAAKLIRKGLLAKPEKRTLVTLKSGL